MIRHKNLSTLANRLYQKQGGRRIPEEILERDYCLSWLLVGLSISPLNGALTFKGGTAIKKCYIGDYRFSGDLDFTIVGETTIEKILEQLKGAFEDTKSASRIIFDLASEGYIEHINGYTFYLQYEGPIPRTYARTVKVDITKRELLSFNLEYRPVLKGYEEYEDLPKDANICVYSLNEIAAEKVVALLDKARSQPRDLYDMWYLTSERYVNLADLFGAVKDKLDFRGKSLSGTKEIFLGKEKTMEELWESNLSPQVQQLPEFNRVYRLVQRELRQASLLM